MKIVTAAQMKEIDLACTRTGTPVSVLMENAGKAVAEETRGLLGALPKQDILCLVGPGNNGGDGLVAARYLHEWGAKVTVYLCAARPAADANLKMARERGITCVDASADEDLENFDGLLECATCVVDALLGTGRMRPLEGLFKEVLERVNAVKKSRQLVIVAVDLPTGLDADTGVVDDACLEADLTVTLAFPKPGLFLFPGAEKVGKLKIVDIGISASLAGSIFIELLTPDWAKTVLPKRPLNTNKGSFGKVMVAAGSINYSGAAYLACSGALRVGVGLVTLATAASLQPVLAAKLAEVTYLPLPENEPGVIAAGGAEVMHSGCRGYTVLLLGCGLGQHPDTAEFVGALLDKKGLPPLVIDADALNIISKMSEWWRHLPDDAVLTPHPGELSRLSGLSIEKIQSDRMKMAIKLAGEWGKTVVLKGAYSVIAAADGRCSVSPFANPGLATAGTGDVLAGVIAGLAAQGLPLFEAASLGVYLHGAAGEVVREILGNTGMIASDLFSALPVTMKNIREQGPSTFSLKE